MSNAIITLTYRQIIDAATEGNFARNVLRYSYEEFTLKSQVYNPAGDLNTFTEMKQRDGRANSLHYKTGFAAAGFINELQQQIPGLYDRVSKPMQFASYEFELIESALNNPLLHIVAIHYITAPLVLHDTIGECMVLSYAGANVAEKPLPAATFVLSMVPGLSVSQYQSLTKFHGEK